jgi:hypothetical protein
VSSFGYWTGPRGVKRQGTGESGPPAQRGVGAPGTGWLNSLTQSALSRAAALVGTSSSRLLGSSEPNTYRTTHFSVSVRP